MKLRVLPVVAFIVVLADLALAPVVFAGPTNGTYEMVEYGFGAGGGSSSNGTYGVNGIVGEVSSDQATNGTYKINSGLEFTHMAHVPPAPTLTNPGSHYDRLKIVINTDNNPSDTTYALAISSDNFVTTQYVQSDGTVGTVLGSEDWLTYTGWGGASGSFITSLTQATTYKVKVKAEQGDFTETPYGPETAGVATVTPSLTFGVSANSVTFSNLNSGNSYTDSSRTTILTTSTNAYNGYIVYGRVTQPLTSGSNTIGNYASSNSSPTTWSGTGFGYTTNDSSLTGGTANRFTNGGPKYAGFTTSSPGDPVADHPGPLSSPVVAEPFTVTYRVTAASTQLAGVYRSTILYVIVPTF